MMTKEQTFLVGFGKADVTPYKPVPLASYGNTMKRVSIGYLDHLYAIVVVMTDVQDHTLVLVVTDMSWGHIKQTRELRELIADKYGIPGDCVVLGGTHNHNAPSWFLDEPMTEEYLAYWMDGIMSAVEMAMEDRKAATIKIGRTETEGLTFVRRYIQEDGNYRGIGPKITDSPIVDYETPADEEVQMVLFTREGGRDILIANWQCHGCKVGNTLYAASDWIGPCRDKLEKELDVHCIYFQGAAGNLATGTRLEGVQTPDTAQEMGERVAEVIIESHKQNDTFCQVQTGEIRTKQVTLTANVRQDEKHKLEAAKELRKLWHETQDKTMWRRLGIPQGIYGLQHANAIVSRETAGETKDMELNAISIGDVSIVTLPVELFDMSGQQLKSRTPSKMTLLMGYACGITLYAPADSIWDHGLYEVNNSLFERGTAEKIVDTYLELLNEFQYTDKPEK